MNCCFSLCNPINPYGCCHPGSPFTDAWYIPLMTITCPIWFPIMALKDCCLSTKEIIDHNVEWSESHQGYGTMNKIPESQ